MILLLSTILVIVGSINAIPLLEVEREWSKFLEEFNPVYKDPTERQYRKQIFQQNLENIQKHNAEYDLGLHTYSTGVNQFADKTVLEITQSSLGLNSHAIRNNIKRSRKWFRANPEEKLPESIDWRQKGAVTRVKHQGNCGSCWAFSAVGALEGQYFLATNKTVSFSAQQLVDCSESNSGCDGGDQFAAYLDLKKMGGVTTEDLYPYEGDDGYCEFKKRMAVTKVIGVEQLSCDEEGLKEIIALKGPIAAGIHPTFKFQVYNAGVFYDKHCSHDLDDITHAVLIVGYGSENGTDYWLVKNSWGKSWGEKGYIRMSRNRNNNCMIASDILYPKIQPILH